MRTPAVLMLWLRLCGIVLMLAGSHAANAEVDFLDPEVAFKFDAQAQGERSVEISFRVAPGYSCTASSSGSKRPTRASTHRNCRRAT